jgi:hypothetical protein
MMTVMGLTEMAAKREVAERATNAGKRRASVKGVCRTTIAFLAKHAFRTTLHAPS